MNTVRTQPPTPDPGLESLGWCADLAGRFAALALPGLVPGRVAAEHKNYFTVLVAGASLTAQISGRLQHRIRNSGQLPKVGDWVACSRAPRGNTGLIQAVLERRSALSRKVPGHSMQEQVLAANVDWVFIVAALDMPLNPRRLERYLVLTHESRARTAVLLNKADLHPAPDRAAEEVRAVAPGVPVLAASAQTGEGFGALSAMLLAGSTAVFVGPSGAGKSSIINRLAGRDIQSTQTVRAGDQKGRHTTTRRDLILLPGGALVIDSPGLRELQLWTGDESLATAFPDIEALASGCRFRDCRHDHEAGCAVTRALAEGGLAGARYESYQKLRREQALQERRQNLTEKLRDKSRNRQFLREFNRLKRARS